MLRNLTLAALSACALSGCRLYSKNIEYSYLMVETAAEPAQHPTKLRLKGRIVSGILVPKRFHSEVEGHSMLITLTATFATRGHYNEFDVTFDIPTGVDEARFGHSKELIWSREQPREASNQAMQRTAGRSAARLKDKLKIMKPKTFALASGR